MAQSVVDLEPTYQLANQVFNLDTGNKISIETLIKGPDANTWNRSPTNEFGRLAQGMGQLHKPLEQVRGTNTLFFILLSKVPNNVKVTYANFICDIRSLKPEKHRVRLTVGGDKLDYEEDPSSPAVSLLDTKILLNSLILDADEGARYCIADIKIFYLNNRMKT